MATRGLERPEEPQQPDGRATRRTGNRLRRRTAVLSAALEVIAEKGFSDTRMVDIAGRAGMSAGHTLYYFSSRADVLMQALEWSEDRFIQTTTDAIAQLEPGRAKLWCLVERAVPETGTDPAWILWLETWAQAPHHPDMARVAVRIETAWLALLTRVVREGQEVGAFADVPAERFATVLDALISGLTVRTLAGGGLAREELLGICAELIDHELCHGSGEPDTAMPCPNDTRGVTSRH